MQFVVISRFPDLTAYVKRTQANPDLPGTEQTIQTFNRTARANHGKYTSMYTSSTKRTVSSPCFPTTHDSQTVTSRFSHVRLRILLFLLVSLLLSILAIHLFVTFLPTVNASQLLLLICFYPENQLLRSTSATDDSISRRYVSSSSSRHFTNSSAKFSSDIILSAVTTTEYAELSVSSRSPNSPEQLILLQVDPNCDTATLGN